MTPADLKKEAGKGPYKGIARSQIIKLKIADKKEFTLNNGAKIKGTNWDEKTYTLFVGTRKISLKEVKKDPDFGGGGCRGLRCWNRQRRGVGPGGAHDLGLGDEAGERRAIGDVAFGQSGLGERLAVGTRGH